MNSWATVAIKHVALTSGFGLGAVHTGGWDSLNGFAAGLMVAGLGFAALDSSRRMRRCPAPTATPGCGYQRNAHRSARSGLHVGGLLAGILSDHAEFVPPAAVRLPGSAAHEDGRQFLAFEQHRRHDARHLTAEEGFWGSRTAPAGYRSRHRLGRSARDTRPPVRLRGGPRRAGPRHAASPGRFSVALSRTLVGAALTSPSATHAAW